MSGSGDAVRFLLARDYSSLEAKDHDGRTALHLASGHRLGSDSTLIALVESGANVEATTALGETPLHKACKALRVSAVQQLLRYGANQAAVDAGGRTPAALTAQLFQSQCPGMFRDMLQKILSLLATAPADRRWRRRGWLLMLRSRQQGEGEHADDGVSVAGTRWLPRGKHRRILGTKCNGAIAVGAVASCKCGKGPQDGKRCAARPWKVEKTRNAPAALIALESPTIFARDSGHDFWCCPRIRGTAPSSCAAHYGRGVTDEAVFLRGGEGGGRALRSVVERAVGFHEDGLFRNIVAFL